MGEEHAEVLEERFYFLENQEIAEAGYKKTKASLHDLRKAWEQGAASRLATNAGRPRRTNARR